MKIRLFHKGSRFVLVLRREEGDISEHRWLALHLAPHRWAHIFDVARRILDLTSGPEVDLHWTPARYWTKIDLRLTQGSLRKRQLIAAALLKAARYQVL